MSALAWSTVALLLFLFPGFLFFLGPYTEERFTREVEQRSPLGQLAAVLLVSWGVHAFLYLAFTGTCHLPFPTNPCVSLEHVFAAFQLQGSVDAVGFGDLVENIESYALWIIGYVGIASAGGFGLGLIYGKLLVCTDPGSVSDFFSRLARHDWVHKLDVQDEEGWTSAYVFTSIREDNRILMYKGVLYRFGLNADGTFSHLILDYPHRCYVRLQYQEARVDSELHEIGSSSIVAQGSRREPNRTHLYLSGKNIENVVFHQFDLNLPDSAGGNRTAGVEGSEGENSETHHGTTGAD